MTKTMHHKTIADLDLLTVERCEAEAHVMPMMKAIYWCCIQDVMRDYADLCDWANANEQWENHTEHAYCADLMKALGRRIKECMNGTF